MIRKEIYLPDLLSRTPWILLEVLIAVLKMARDG